MKLEEGVDLQVQKEGGQLIGECDATARDIVLLSVRHDARLCGAPVKVFDKHNAAARNGIQHAPPRARAQGVHFVKRIKGSGHAFCSAAVPCMTRVERSGGKRPLVVDEMADGYKDQRLCKQMRKFWGRGDAVRDEVVNEG